LYFLEVFFIADSINVGHPTLRREVEEIRGLQLELSRELKNIISEN
jgi:hypothetical protein